jgi:cyclophilin family peptidyl-prolyl cis-trans isomerase
VGTDKRERQKANRQLKLQEMARDARRAKTKKRALQIGLGIPLAIGAVFGLVRLLGNSSSSSVTAATSTSVGSDVGTSTSSVGSTASTTPVVTTIGAAPTKDASGAYPCPPADGSAERVVAFPKTLPTCTTAGKTYTAVIETNKGSYTVALDSVNSPQNVNLFVYLARYHFYDQTICHRVIKDFMVQCGDPTGTGSGGAGVEVPVEAPKSGKYAIGTLAMAKVSGASTNGSQFFVVTGAQGVSLPADYSLLGQVTAGFDTTVKALEAAADPNAANGVPPLEQLVITKVTITEQ